MLIRQGSARTIEVDRRLACFLAAIAGALNAAVFHAVGFFSANMTGNVSLLSNHIAFGSWGLAGFFLAIVLVFISGALVSTLIINEGRRREARGIYAFNILVEAVLLSAIGAAYAWLDKAHGGTVLILGLAFLMGLQNAVVTQISEARVRTTHISGMSTDIGIELGHLIDIVRGKERRDASATNLSKLRLHVETVLSFLAGGVLGVLAFRLVGGAMLFLVTFILFAVAGVSLLRSRTTDTDPAQPASR